MQNTSASHIVKIVKVLLCVLMCVGHIYPPNLDAFESERGSNIITLGPKM